MDLTPDTNVRSLDPAAVDRIRARLVRLDAAVRAALVDPSRVGDMIDEARWARLDVDVACAMKQYLYDLRDAEWARLRFTDRDAALDTFRAFLAAPRGSLDLAALRNLRLRLDGLLAVARGLAAAPR